MKDEQCVRFLQWALPQLHMRWPGFRTVRRQVCKRVDRRIGELGLASIDDYRAWLEGQCGLMCYPGLHSEGAVPSPSTSRKISSSPLGAH